MKFNLENFLELDTTQLLAVNGGSGCGGSSGGGSSSGGASSSSSSGSGGSSGGGSSSYGGGSSGSSSGGGGGGSCGGVSSSGVSSNGGGASSGGSGGGSCGGGSIGGGISSNGVGGGSCGGSANATNTVVSSVKTASSGGSGGGSCSSFDLTPYMQPEGGSWGGIEKGSANDKSKMQDYQKFAENAEMNGTSINTKGEQVDNTYSAQGCKMEGAAKISTEILGTHVDIRDVNRNYDKDQDGLLSQYEITTGIQAGLGKGKTLSVDYYEQTLSKSTLDAIAASKEGTTYMLGRAENVGGGQHWVVLEGYSINDRGQVQFDFNGTSENDAGRTYILGTPEAGQANTYSISKIETYMVK